MGGGQTDFKLCSVASSDCAIEQESFLLLLLMASFFSFLAPRPHLTFLGGTAVEVRAQQEIEGQTQIVTLLTSLLPTLLTSQAIQTNI